MYNVDKGQAFVMDTVVSELMGKPKQEKPIDSMIREHKGVKHGDNVNVDVLALTQAVEFIVQNKHHIKTAIGVLNNEMSGLDNPEKDTPHFYKAKQGLLSLSDSLDSATGQIESMFDSWQDNKLDAKLKSVVGYINNVVCEQQFSYVFVRACRLAQRLANGEYNVPVEEWEEEVKQSDKRWKDTMKQEHGVEV